ncbi:MAG: CCA tRNA nucleotidyltransferase [Oscillospiraceae bacterium]|nr:CCA tRNA nucleotidyltransferase [Oscillospiraceae bacterium]
MLPQEVRQVLHTLSSAGHEAYVVGGCVRDILRGVAPHDWDITTSALPEETMSLFPHFAIPTGLKHGTVTVLSGGCPCEVTTYRADGDYSDHRRPDGVTFTRSLREDLARRDFTVNAMAMDENGEVVDPFGGREDLAAGILRCVGEPAKRFSEDALRILRALRFAATLGFAIEEETGRAIFALRDDLHYVAAERVREELTKLLLGDSAEAILTAFPTVLGAVIPELLPAVGFDQRNCHHCLDVWGHTARAVGKAAKDSIIRWTMLLHDLGKPDTFTVDGEGVGHFYTHADRSEEIARQVVQRLRFDKASAQRIVRLVRYHDRPFALTEKSMARALRKLGVEDTFALCAVKRADNLAQHPDYHDRQAVLDEAEALLHAVLEKDSCFSLKHLAVDGNDLLALGLRGKAIGQVLEQLLTAVMDGELPNEKAALLNAAKEQI